MAFPWSIATGIVGSFLSSRSAKRAAERQANAVAQAAGRYAQTVRKEARPYKEMTSFAFPKLRQLIMDQYAPAVDQEDPYLRAAHEENVRDIGRQTNRALASSAFSWGRTGNTGRARGEALRIKRAGTEATNQENVNYGESQRQNKIEAAGRFGNSLSLLLDMGRTGMELATRAAGIQAQGATTAAGINSQASQDLYGDLGSLFGIGIGDYLADRDITRLNSVLGTGSDQAAPGGVNASGLTEQVMGSLPGAGGIRTGETEEPDLGVYGIRIPSMATRYKKRMLASAGGS